MYAKKTLTRNKCGGGLYYYGQTGGARGSFLKRLPMVKTLTRALPLSAKFKRGGCPAMIVEVEPTAMPEIPKKQQGQPKGRGITPYGSGITPYGGSAKGRGIIPYGGKRGGNYSNDPASPTELNPQQLDQLRELRAVDPYAEAPIFDRHSLNLLSNVIQSKQILESETKKKPALKGSGMRLYHAN